MSTAIIAAKRCKLIFCDFLHKNLCNMYMCKIFVSIFIQNDDKITVFSAKTAQSTGKTRVKISYSSVDDI